MPYPAWLTATVGLIALRHQAISGRMLQRCRGKPPWMSLKENTGGQSDPLKWSVLVCWACCGLPVVLMYVQEYLFAIMTLILSPTAWYIFANRKPTPRCYCLPVPAWGCLEVFPLRTIAIALPTTAAPTSSPFERAQQVLADRSYQAGKPITSVLPGRRRVATGPHRRRNGQTYSSGAFSFGGEQKLQLEETDTAGRRTRHLRIITQNRLALNQITAVLPDESKVIMSLLRQFSGTRPLYTG